MMVSRLFMCVLSSMGCNVMINGTVMTVEPVLGPFGTLMWTLPESGPTLEASVVYGHNMHRTGKRYSMFGEERNAVVHKGCRLSGCGPEWHHGRSGGEINLHHLDSAYDNYLTELLVRLEDGHYSVDDSLNCVTEPT